MYRLAAYFRIWDIEGWLREINWEQLQDWLEFMEEEPHGEERADLRVGALGSILWNVNLDTREEGMLRPDSYFIGWNEERVHYLGLKPIELREKEKEDRESGRGGESPRGRKFDLSDPVGWENFTAKLVKLHGGKKSRPRN